MRMQFLRILPEMCAGDDVPIFQLHTEHGVGRGVDDSTFHFEAVFFRQLAVEPSVSMGGPFNERWAVKSGVHCARKSTIAPHGYQVRATQRWMTNSSMGRYWVL